MRRPGKPVSHFPLTHLLWLPPQPAGRRGGIGRGLNGPHPLARFQRQVLCTPSSRLGSGTSTSPPYPCRRDLVTHPSPPRDPTPRYPLPPSTPESGSPPHRTLPPKGTLTDWLVDPGVFGGAWPALHRERAILGGLLLRRQHHPLRVGLDYVPGALGLEVNAAVGRRGGDRGDALGRLVADHLAGSRRARGGVLRSGQGRKRARCGGAR